MTGLKLDPCRIVPNSNKIMGRVCDKHPELNGLRYYKGHNCVGCAADKSIMYKKIPALEEAIRRLETRLLRTERLLGRIANRFDCEIEDIKEEDFEVAIKAACAALERKP